MTTFLFDTLQRFKTGLWAAETVGKGCFRNSEYSTVSNQEACQALCEAKTTCIGISSTMDGRGCMTCDGEKLVRSPNYTFYRRPGNSISYLRELNLGAKIVNLKRCSAYNLPFSQFQHKWLQSART